MTRAVTLAEIAAEEVFTVDGTNSRIGIGTTQPTTKLDVDGTISADGIVTDSFGIGTTSPQSELTVRGSTPQITLEPTADTQDCRIQFATTDGTIQSSVRGGGSLDGDIKFVSGSSELVRIESGGNLGIGITNPTSRLHIKSSTPIIRLTPTGSGQTTRLTFTDENDSAQNTIRGESGDLVFRGSNAEHMRIDSSGNVGIGTDSPTGVLEIAGNSGVQTINYGGGGTTGYFLSRTNVDRPNADQAIHVNQFRWNGTQVASIKALTGDDTVNKDNGYLTFETSDGSGVAERMRIDTEGNIGIGTTNPTTLLEIQSSGSGNAAGPVYSLMRNSASPANNDRLGTIHFDGKDSLDGRVIYKSVYARIDSTTSGSATGRLIVGSDESAGNEQVVIDGSGNVGIGTDNLGSRLHVEGTTGSTSRIHISSTSNGDTSFDGSGSGLLLTAGNMNTTSKFTPAIQFGSTDSNFTTTNPKVFAAINAIASDGFFADTDGGMDLAFYTTGANPGTGQTITERMRILSSGGLTFNGDTATANALNDYEEGTWTPVFRGATTAGSYTYGSQVGNYTKIGNKVTVTATLLDITTVSAGSGTLEISGLPFAQAGDFSSGDIYMAHFDVDNSTVSLSSRIDGSNSHILAVETRDALSGSVVLVTDKASNSADIIATITYFTNS